MLKSLQYLIKKDKKTIMWMAAGVLAIPLTFTIFNVGYEMIAEKRLTREYNICRNLYTSKNGGVSMEDLKPFPNAPYTCEDVVKNYYNTFKEEKNAGI